MTPEERAERERRELIYRRHAEMQVIQLAIKHVEVADYGPDLSLLIAAIKDLERRYQRTGTPLTEAFEREAEALVRQLDAPQVPAAPQHDPLSGDLIPAGQDAELEQWGRDMAAPGSAFAELVRPEIEAMGNPIRDLAIQAGIIPPEPEDCDCPRDQQVYCASLKCHGGDDVLIWHPRTMKDARKGDQIRPVGSDMPNGTAVTDRLLPPQPAVPTRYGPLPADRDTWHVVPGAKHWDDHVVQPGEVWLCLDGGAPRNVDPDFPIEILLTRAEIAAIELLGWDNREETRS